MNDASLQQYYNEITTFPLLNEEEEKELLIKAQSGDIDSRNKIISANLRLVISIAKKYTNVSSSFDLLDIINEGNLGLMNAVERYDFTRDVKFSTCAIWYIKQSITRAIENKGRAIRIPSYIQEGISKMLKVEADLALSLGRNPTDKEIADKLNIPVERLSLFKINDFSIGSTDFYIDEDEENTLYDIIEDRECITPESNIDSIAKKEMFDMILQTLNEKERAVIDYRFGLSTGHPYTLEEIGKLLRLSKERIRQIEDKALRKLRNPLRAKMLRNALT